MVAVRVAEEGAVDYETRGRYDPPKLWFPCSFYVLFVVQWPGGTEVDTSAGTLSEAKTQRRPHSVRERVRGWEFPLLFRCFCIFLLAGQEEDT